jgi:hypothetical protein
MSRRSGVKIVPHIIGLLSICLVAGTGFCQTNPPHTSLCDLQSTVAAGEHVTVTLSGEYLGGLGDSGRGMGVLEDSSCPAQYAWVEIESQSKLNRKKLHGLLDRANRAYVVFEGDLYGPPLPDPKLPDALRKASNPGWGHLGAFKIKLVVHTIRSVAIAPPSNQQR